MRLVEQSSRVVTMHAAYLSLCLIFSTLQLGNLIQIN